MKICSTGLDTGLTPVLFALQFFKKFRFKISKIVYYSFKHFTILLLNIFSVKMNFLSYCDNQWKKSTKGKQNKSSEDVFILDWFEERDLTKWWRNFVNIFCNDCPNYSFLFQLIQLIREKFSVRRSFAKCPCCAILKSFRFRFRMILSW